MARKFDLISELYDKRYDKYNFLIHDYFFAKSLDKLRPGGVIALVTSKGTMDKENSNVRKYIAQRAELLGAIRLPNDTFKGNAGTEVVSDILFLQKRDRLIDIEPDWVHLDTDENGIRMNSYFVQHPEMILGEMKMVSGRFGPEATCEPFENADLSELLNEAVSNIHGEISEYEVADELEEEDNSIPADPTVRNFSYTILDDKIYFRENSRMSPVEVSATAENRIKGMIGIRDCVRNLIELQTEDYPDSEIKQAPRSKERGAGMSNSSEKKKRYNIPLWCKPNLSIEEAAAYSGIGMGKLYEMTESQDCPFVLWIGSRRMIKRKVFDEFIERQYSI